MPSRSVLVLALAILACNVAWVSSRLGFLHKPQRVAEHDHLRYLEMAKGPAGDAQLARQSPYCYRVLVPALARLATRAGLKLNLAFWLLTNLALLALLLALDRLLEILGFEPRERALGLVLTGFVQGCVRWFEYQYWMTDPAGLFLLVLALVFLHSERVGALGLVNLLAAGVRETHVVVYPYVFLQRLARHGLRDALQTSLRVCMAPLLVYVLLRALIVPLSGPALSDAIADNLGFRLRHLFDNQLYLMTFGTWGVLLVLALLPPIRPAKLGREAWGPFALLLFVYVSTFLISNNNERPLACALPVVLPAALHGLRRLRNRTGLRFVPVASAAVLLQLVVYQQTLFSGLGISVYQPTNLLVTGLLSVAWLLGWWWPGARPSSQARSSCNL